jgi:receptor tyrosine kinase
MFSYGAEPYAEMSNKEVMEFVKKGNRLECPESCPSIIYDELILPCWNEESKRPSLQHIFRILKDLETTYSTSERRATATSLESSFSYQNVQQ